MGTWWESSAISACATAYGYDRAGRVVRVTDPRGTPTAATYDTLGRVQTVTEAAGFAEGRSTQYAYTPAGDLGQVTDPRGFVTAMTYDAGGRLTGQTRAAGTPLAFATAYEYDARDHVTAVVRPGGRRTEAAYDLVGQVTTVTDAAGTPLARSTGFGYDAGGHRVAVTDALGHVTATAYDKLGRPTAVTDPNLATTSIAYDQAGRVLTVTDPNRNATTYAYDAAGRTVTETDPLGQALAYTYDAAGRLLRATDRQGRGREFAYDPAGQVTHEDWYSAAGAKVETHAFGYDATGNLTSASSPAGAYALSYDRLDRPTAVTEPFGVSLAMTYDAAGNRLSVTDTKGGVQASTYDPLGRLSTRELSAAGVTARAAWGYDAAGDATTLTRSEKAGAGGWTAAGATATGYDALGRVTTITTTSGTGATLASYAYGYDAADRMTSETVGGVARAYGYDAAGQLTGDGGAAIGYDPAGNRTSGGGGVGAGNRLTSDGTWAYTYDADGRVVKRSQGAQAETWAYQYDHAGRLVQGTKSASDGGAATLAVGYAYDAFGNRVERTETAGGTTTTERFAYDGWDTAKLDAVGSENFDVWADLDSANAVTNRRLFGPGFDEVVARLSPAGGAAWYGSDVRGSVRAVFDAAGVVTGARDYAGFGAIVSASGSGLDRYAYTGREWDSGLGLQYSRARLYDPASGRFLAEDPIGSGGRDPNLHRYVGNSPTNLTDPSGLQPPARSLQDRFYDGFGVARPGDIARAAAGHVRGRVRGLLGPAAAAAYGVDGVMASGTPVGRMIDNAGVAAEVSLAGAFLAYDQFFGEDTNLDAVGEPGLVLSFVPVYGSGRTAVNAWQNGRYGSAVVNGAFAVLDVSVVTALVRGAVRNGLLRGGARLADDGVGAAGRAELATGRRLPACEAPTAGAAVSQAGLQTSSAQMGGLGRYTSDLRGYLGSRQGVPGLNADLRLQFRRGQGTVAVGELEAGGQTTRVPGFSGMGNVGGFAPYVPNAQRTLPASEVVGGRGNLFLRDVDPEAKILERMLAMTTENTRGTVRLYVDRVPCPSCTNVIVEFQRLRPGVAVEVGLEGGSVYLPALR